MFDWDDVLIIGDSFTAHREKSVHWPMLLTCLLTNRPPEENLIPRGYGFSGCSWWAVRNRLLEECEKRVPRVLVIAHTEPQRIPSDQNFNLNSGSVFHLDNEKTNTGEYDPHQPPKEVALAAQQYYKYLISLNYHIWAQKQWFNELDNIISYRYKIEKVMHLHSFVPWGNAKPHVFKNGTTFTTPLWEICDDKNSTSSQKTYNHFVSSNNIMLAKTLYKSIGNYIVGERELAL